MSISADVRLFVSVFLLAQLLHLDFTREDAEFYCLSFLAKLVNLCRFHYAVLHEDEEVTHIPVTKICK